MRIYYYNEAGNKEQYLCHHCLHDEFYPYIEEKDEVAFLCEHCEEPSAWFKKEELITEE